MASRRRSSKSAPGAGRCPNCSGLAARVAALEVRFRWAWEVLKVVVGAAAALGGRALIM